MEAGRVGDGEVQRHDKTLSDTGSLKVYRASHWSTTSLIGGTTKDIPRGRSLKVYRASRWSAIGLIGGTTKDISKREELEGVSRLPVGRRSASSVTRPKNST